MIKAFLKAQRRIIYVQISSTRIAMESNDGLRWEATPEVGISRKGSDEVISVIKDGSEAGADHLSVSRWVNPFDHPRSILADFTVAEKLICHGLRSMLGGFITCTPAMGIIHPLERIEGGLTTVEERALRELGLGAGFRHCRVHAGSPVLVQGMTLKNMDNRLKGQGDDR